MSYSHQPRPKCSWARRSCPNGTTYEVSSKGDKRFSALYAIMQDGRSIEQHYQCDVKGYCPGGTNWKLGKGRPPLDTSFNLYEAYKNLRRIWCRVNPALIEDLRNILMSSQVYVLTDCFAHTEINQARALSELINEEYPLPVSM